MRRIYLIGTYYPKTRSGKNFAIGGLIRALANFLTITFIVIV